MSLKVALNSLKVEMKWHLVFSFICRTIKKASTVPEPCLKTRHRLSPTTSSVFSLILLRNAVLQALQGMERDDSGDSSHAFDCRHFCV